MHLKVMYANKLPFVSVDKSSFKVNGLFGNIFLFLQDKLQFGFTLIEQTDKRRGNYYENGSFDGVIGQLQRGEIDWSLSNYRVTPERMSAIDFSQPVSYFPLRLVSKSPNEELNWMAYLSVFTGEFWIVLLTTTIVLSFSLYLMLKYKQKDGDQWLILTAFCFTLESLCCREYNSLRSNLSGKLLIWTILCWGFLIASAYNAILTSVIAVAKITPPIRSLEDLHTSNEYKLFLSDGGAIMDYFKSAPSNDIGKLKTFT